MNYQLTGFELFRGCLYLTVRRMWGRKVIRTILKALLFLTAVMVFLACEPGLLKIGVPLLFYVLVSAGIVYGDCRQEGRLLPTEFTVEEGRLKADAFMSGAYPFTKDLIVREYMGLLFLFWPEGESFGFLLLPVRIFPDHAEKVRFLQLLREEAPAGSSGSSQKTDPPAEEVKTPVPEDGKHLLGGSARLAWKRLWGVSFLKPGLLLLTTLALAVSVLTGSGKLFGLYVSLILLLLLVFWSLSFSFAFGSRLEEEQKTLPLKVRLPLFLLSGLLLAFAAAHNISRRTPAHPTCEEQLQILEELELTVPEELAKELKADADYRSYIEAEPFYDLLTVCGMPAWDSETYETVGYSDQSYWFDFEGWDISTDYIEILKGVQALADGTLTITDMEEDTGGLRWEEGTGSIRITFQINGTPCAYTAAVDNDWIDPGFLTYLQKALDKEDGARRLYACSDNGQGCILFYRTDSWAEQFTQKTGITLY